MMTTRGQEWMAIGWDGIGLVRTKGYERIAFWNVQGR